MDKLWSPLSPFAGFLPPGHSSQAGADETKAATTGIPGTTGTTDVKAPSLDSLQVDGWIALGNAMQAWRNKVADSGEPAHIEKATADIGQIDAFLLSDVIYASGLLDLRPLAANTQLHAMPTPVWQAVQALFAAHGAQGVHAQLQGHCLSAPGHVARLAQGLNQLHTLESLDVHLNGEQDVDLEALKHPSLIVNVWTAPPDQSAWGSVWDGAADTTRLSLPRDAIAYGDGKTSGVTVYMGGQRVGLVSPDVLMQPGLGDLMDSLPQMPLLSSSSDGAGSSTSSSGHLPGPLPVLPGVDPTTDLLGLPDLPEAPPDDDLDEVLRLLEAGDLPGQDAPADTLPPDGKLDSKQGMSSVPGDTAPAAVRQRLHAALRNWCELGTHDVQRHRLAVRDRLLALTESDFASQGATLYLSALAGNEQLCHLPHDAWRALRDSYTAHGGSVRAIALPPLAQEDLDHSTLIQGLNLWPALDELRLQLPALRQEGAEPQDLNLRGLTRPGLKLSIQEEAKTVIPPARWRLHVPLATRPRLGTGIHGNSNFGSRVRLHYYPGAQGRPVADAPLNDPDNTQVRQARGQARPPTPAEQALRQALMRWLRPARDGQGTQTPVPAPAPTRASAALARALLALDFAQPRLHLNLSTLEDQGERLGPALAAVPLAVWQELQTCCTAQGGQLQQLTLPAAAAGLLTRDAPLVAGLNALTGLGALTLRLPGSQARSTRAADLGGLRHPQVKLWVQEQTMASTQGTTWTLTAPHTAAVAQHPRQLRTSQLTTRTTVTYVDGQGRTVEAGIPLAKAQAAEQEAQAARERQRRVADGLPLPGDDGHGEDLGGDSMIWEPEVSVDMPAPPTRSFGPQTPVGTPRTPAQAGQALRIWQDLLANWTQGDGPTTPTIPVVDALARQAVAKALQAVDVTQPNASIDLRGLNPQAGDALARLPLRLWQALRQAFATGGGSLHTLALPTIAAARLDGLVAGLNALPALQRLVLTLPDPGVRHTTFPYDLAGLAHGGLRIEVGHVPLKTDKVSVTAPWLLSVPLAVQVVQSPAMKESKPATAWMRERVTVRYLGQGEQESIRAPLARDEPAQVLRVRQRGAGGPTDTQPLRTPEQMRARTALQDSLTQWQQAADDQDRWEQVTLLCNQIDALDPAERGATLDLSRLPRGDALDRAFTAAPAGLWAALAQCQAAHGGSLGAVALPPLSAGVLCQGAPLLDGLGRLPPTVALHLRLPPIAQTRKGQPKPRPQAIDLSGLGARRIVLGDALLGSGRRGEWHVTVALDARASSGRGTLHRRVTFIHVNALSEAQHRHTWQRPAGPAGSAGGTDLHAPSLPALPAEGDPPPGTLSLDGHTVTLQPGGTVVVDRVARPGQLTPLQQAVVQRLGTPGGSLSDDEILQLAQQAGTKKSKPDQDPQQAAKRTIENLVGNAKDVLSFKIPLRQATVMRGGEEVHGWRSGDNRSEDAPQAPLTLPAGPTRRRQAKKVHVSDGEVLAFIAQHHQAGVRPGDVAHWLREKKPAITQESAASEATRRLKGALAQKYLTASGDGQSRIYQLTDLGRDAARRAALQAGAKRKQMDTPPDMDGKQAPPLRRESAPDTRGAERDESARPLPLPVPADPAPQTEPSAGRGLPPSTPIDLTGPSSPVSTGGTAPVAEVGPQAPQPMDLSGLDPQTMTAQDWLIAQEVLRQPDPAQAAASVLAAFTPQPQPQSQPSLDPDMQALLQQMTPAEQQMALQVMRQHNPREVAQSLLAGPGLTPSQPPDGKAPGTAPGSVLGKRQRGGETVQPRPLQPVPTAASVAPRASTAAQAESLLSHMALVRSDPGMRARFMQMTPQERLVTQQLMQQIDPLQGLPQQASPVPGVTRLRINGVHEVVFNGSATYTQGQVMQVTQRSKDFNPHLAALSTPNGWGSDSVSWTYNLWMVGLHVVVV